MRRTSYAESFRVKDELMEFTRQIGTRLILRIVTRLAHETPVDTGQARFNWLTTVDAPDGRQFRIKYMPATVASLAAIARAETVLRGAGKYRRLYVCNNLPYIERLNQGWSGQAPSLFVDTIIEQEVSRADR